jgi:hypothetical protein
MIWVTILGNLHMGKDWHEVHEGENGYPDIKK